jgi:hypothetical protein
MKFHLLIILTLVLSSSVFGQDKPACNLSLKEAPTVRGLKLGMTLKQVEDLVGERLTLDNKPTSVSEAKTRTTINVGEKQALLVKFKGANFDGVIVLQLWFFNDILSGFEIMSRNPNAKWENSSKFIDYVSTTFKLPRNGWKEVYPNSVLSCKEFSLGANLSGWGDSLETLLITNSIIADRLKKLANETYLKGLKKQ